jgi:hypothetical protein
MGRGSRSEKMPFSIFNTRKHGSFTREESLAALVTRGLVQREEAVARSGHRDELEQLGRNAHVR